MNYLQYHILPITILPCPTFTFIITAHSCCFAQNMNENLAVSAASSAMKCPKAV